MWAVEAARESELRRACDEQGVQISVIGDQLNALVASIAGRVENDETTPPPQTHMPIVQSAMRHAAGEDVLLNLRDPAAADQTGVQRGSSPCPFRRRREPLQVIEPNQRHCPTGGIQPNRLKFHEI